MTGAQLRTIREHLGLTQKEFGERMGVHANSIARLERDEANITDTMSKLACTFVDPTLAEKLLTVSK